MSLDWGNRLGYYFCTYQKNVSVTKSINFGSFGKYPKALNGLTDKGITQNTKTWNEASAACKSVKKFFYQL